MCCDNDSIINEINICTAVCSSTTNMAPVKDRFGSMTFDAVDRKATSLIVRTEDGAFTAVNITRTHPCLVRTKVRQILLQVSKLKV